MRVDDIIRALRTKVDAATDELDIAVAVHETWKVAARDRALHARIGTSRVAVAFYIIRDALRRDVILALMRLWDKDRRAVGMKSIANNLCDTRVVDALAADCESHWGTLDGALGMLLSTMEDLPYSHGADMYGDLPSSTKFARMRQVLKRSSAPAAANASKKLKSYKKTYERCSDIRNFIAHSHCPGIWTIDRDIILFAPFRSPASGQVALNLVPIQEVLHATRWGDELKRLFLRVARGDDSNGQP